MTDLNDREIGTKCGCSIQFHPHHCKMNTEMKMQEAARSCAEHTETIVGHGSTRGVRPSVDGLPDGQGVGMRSVRVVSQD
jgi:hypothetical protein